MEASLMTAEWIGYDRINWVVSLISVPTFLIAGVYGIWFSKNGHHDLKDSMTNFFIAVVHRILKGLVWIPLAVFFYTQANRLGVFQMDPSNVWHWVLGVLVADICYYWDHRIAHQVKFIWTFHSVHHSSEKFNLLTAPRLSWFEDFYRWMALLPLAFFGFPPLMTIACFLVIRFYQIFLHLAEGGRWGILEKILVSPSLHRVHHGKNPGYLDRNYGGILSIWDHLFGTAVEEKDQVVYGIPDRIGSHHPWTIQMEPIRRLVRSTRAQTTLSGKLKHLWGRPG